MALIEAFSAKNHNQSTITKKNILSCVRLVGQLSELWELKIL